MADREFFPYNKKLRDEDVFQKFLAAFREAQAELQQLRAREGPSVIVKNTTGDPTTPLANGVIVINTVDNTLKMYADGAFRTMAVW